MQRPTEFIHDDFEIYGNGWHRLAADGRTSLSVAAQSAHTALKDKSGKDVGVVGLTQTAGGVLISSA